MQTGLATLAASLLKTEAVLQELVAARSQVDDDKQSVGLQIERLAGLQKQLQNSLKRAADTAASSQVASATGSKIDEAALAAAAGNALAFATAQQPLASRLPTVLQANALIQVSSDAAPAWQMGQIGTVHSVKGNTVYYIAAGSKTGLDKTPVDRNHCVVLQRMPGERAAKTRQLQHLAAADCDKWVEHWHVTDFAEEEVRQNTMLDFTELDAGSFEILWRVQPAKTVYFPPFLSAFISRLGPKAGSEHELLEARASAMDLLNRAELVLIPLWGDAPGHWTLLALQRSGSGIPEPAFPAAAPASRGTARPNDPHKAMRLLARQEETALILEQSRRQLLQPAGECAWTARYYETLKRCHAGCWGVGQALLQQLGLKVEMPDVRENRSRQQASDCGFWVLHHIEEESRRQRGEGAWTQAYDLNHRVELVQGIVKKLKLAEERVKTRRKLELAKEKAEKAAAE